MAFTSNREDQLLLSRLDDLCTGAEKYKKSNFLGFLDERQQKLCLDALHHSHITFRFWGGCEDAERAYLGVSPWDKIDTEEFPVSCVELRFRPGDPVGHRDILGSLMGLNLKREAVGDIVVEEGRAYLFVSSTVLPVILIELDKVGHCGVKCRETAPGEVTIEHRYEEISGTIASPRLDCAVAFLTHSSRSTVLELIRCGKVAVDGVIQEDVARVIVEGSKLSIRGVGKFIYDGQHGTSKKDRLRVSFRKYS